MNLTVCLQFHYSYYSYNLIPATLRQSVSLAAGVRLGPYEILSAIGAGGMGEVYRARDPKLIPGIYNYCDRWCERCPFTSRCMVYAMGEEDRDDPV